MFVNRIFNVINLDNHTANASKSKGYKSFQKYYDDKNKHKRKDVQPIEVFKAPITFNHNIGFTNSKKEGI